MHGSAYGLHHHGSDEIARDRGKWLYAEDKDQQRSGERTTAHTGQSNNETNEESRKGDQRIDVQWTSAAMKFVE